jgi:hypothetical protein
MNAGVAPSSRLATAVMAAAGAATVGAPAGFHPKIAAGVIGGGGLLALAFVAPVAHLVSLLFIAAIVPFSIQNAFSFGGGAGVPGLLPSDVLLLGGLLRAGLVLLDRRPPRRLRTAFALLVAFLAVATVQFAHGLAAGHDPSTTGVELRALVGFGVFIVALPILADDAARERLFSGLLVVGIALGLWGLVQWTLKLPFSVVADVGVRSGVPFTTTGRGALQGGLYAYHIAVVLAVAALVVSNTRSPLRRLLLVAVLALNSVDLLLTYERILWVSTLAAIAFVAFKASGSQRAKAIVLGPSAVAMTIASFAILAPTDFTTARERLLSVGQYATDKSLRSRKLEAHLVTQQVTAHPLAGSGLGATILWGRPYENVKPVYQSFSHNGYLWLVWKLGIAGGGLLILLLAWAVVRRRGPPSATTDHAMMIGAQAALFACLLQGFIYPNFVSSTTAAMGLLVALAMSPWSPSAAHGRPW